MANANSFNSLELSSTFLSPKTFKRNCSLSVCTAIKHSHLCFLLVLQCYNVSTILLARGQFPVPSPPCCSGYQETERPLVHTALPHGAVLNLLFTDKESRILNKIHLCSLPLFRNFFSTTVDILSLEPSEPLHTHFHTPPSAFKLFRPY